MSTGQKRVAIVTGASSGIGQNIASELSRQGYAVVLCGRNKEGLETTSKQCQGNGTAPEDILQIQGDLADPQEPERIVSATTEKFGRINVLINNAGFANLPDTLKTVTAESFDSVFRVNIRAPVLLTKACMPCLEKTKGVIINISSMITTKPNLGMVTYGMTKAAMDYFTKSVACECGSKGVRVCGILPGCIQTPAQDIGKAGLPEEVKDSIDQRTLDSQLVNRLGNVEDISKAAVFLLSEDASFITGENIVIDGGYRFGESNIQQFDQPLDGADKK